METIPEPSAVVATATTKSESPVKGKVKIEPVFEGLTVLYAAAWTLLVACAVYVSTKTSFDIFIETAPPPPPPPPPSPPTLGHWLLCAFGMDK